MFQQLQEKTRGTEAAAAAATALSREEQRTSPRRAPRQLSPTLAATATPPISISNIGDSSDEPKTPQNPPRTDEEIGECYARKFEMRRKQKQRVRLPYPPSPLHTHQIKPKPKSKSHCGKATTLLSQYSHQFCRHHHQRFSVLNADFVVRLCSILTHYIIRRLNSKLFKMSMR
ncbi:PREDICTED: uncharacterized protein LOC108381784 [Rhagoletis zephyria]|uniref:uncharacterized protein LOC108381784 n=1 Tax=Rhagoletis zephyria TaxID=28612 RepID=UPI00081142DA|nr:PREDICTED: uncharacterized protein LOC108381784 [Rhagoletis zephyria]